MKFTASRWTPIGRTHAWRPMYCGKLVAFETRAEQDCSRRFQPILDGVVTATSLVQDFGQVVLEPGGLDLWEGGPPLGRLECGEPNNSNGGSSEDFAEFQFGGGFNDIIDGTFTLLVEFPADDDTPSPKTKSSWDPIDLCGIALEGGMSWTVARLCRDPRRPVGMLRDGSRIGRGRSTRRQLARRCALGHWLGASTGQHRPAGGWGWINGAALTYDRWGGAEPNDSPAGEDVVQLLPGGFERHPRSIQRHPCDSEFSDGPPPPPACPEDLDETAAWTSVTSAALSSWGTPDGDVDGNGSTDFGDIWRSFQAGAFARKAKPHSKR